MHIRSIRYLLLPILMLMIIQNAFSMDVVSCFELIERWKHSDTLLRGHVFDAYVDQDNTLIIMFFRDGIKVVDDNQAVDLTKYGQGPGEIENWSAMHLQDHSLIVFERSGKLIYFRKKNKTYEYEKTKWLMQDTRIPSIKGAIEAFHKYYVTGFSIDLERKRNQLAGYFLVIFNEKGKLAKSLIKKEYKDIYRGPFLMASHIRQARDQVWVMIESKPEVFLIDTKEDVVIKIITLEMPKSYVPIKNYMIFEKTTLEKLRSRYEDWVTSYSRIENMVLSEKHLIVQIRSARPERPKFVLLFYDNKNFQLVNTIDTEHLLLAEKDGRYYFLENGNPGLDIEADKLNILIYRYNDDK